MVVIVILLVLAMLAVAASFNVISAGLGLGLIPEFSGSLFFFAVKTYIADALLWSVLATGALALFSIWRDRTRQLEPARDPREPLADDASVVVALTAYDHEWSIGEAVRDFAGRRAVREVLVVDNNSRDGTALVAARAGGRVVGETQQGYGFACMRGLQEALATGADVIVLAEGDGTFAGKDIAKLLPYLDDADMVIGNRVTPGLVDKNSQMDNFFVWGNKVGGKLLQLKFWDWRFLGRTRLSDLGCTMRAIRAEALAAIIGDLEVGGNHFSPHMIMVALRRGLLVVEVPITFHPRVGISKGASQSLSKGVLVGLSMLWHILSFAGEPTAPYRPAAARQSWKQAALRRAAGEELIIDAPPARKRAA